jgi:hypothetical protein
MAIIKSSMVVPLNNRRCYYVSSSGVYDYGFVNHLTTEASTIIPLPLEVGSAWQRDQYFSCEAITAEDITVPAGTFKTIKVVLITGFTDEEYYEWWADGVGVVKTFTKILNIPIIDITGSATYLDYVVTEELVSKNF